MNKILTTLVGGALLASSLNADLARVEMGVGTWMQTPSGSSQTSDTSGLLSMKGTYTSSESDSSEIYFWALIKHPIPIVPNLRLEYVTLSDEGTTTGTVNGLKAADAPTAIDMTQIDIIPYYNLLDNTFWMTVDVGLDIKVLTTDVKVNDLVATGTDDIFNASESTALPLLYLRGRVEIPATNIGFESDVKYISYDSATMYDIRLKVDYTLDFIPVIQPALELGYRMQKFDVSDSDTNIDLEYAGMYVGLMARF